MGLTLKQVQEATGIPIAYLSQIENGKIKSPSANTMIKLSIAYGIDIQTLMQEGGFIAQKMLVTPALATLQLTEAEERQLIDYLLFIRSKKE